MAARLLVAFLSVLLLTATSVKLAPRDREVYVGSAACEACHADAYAGTWSRLIPPDRHAVVLECLVPSCMPPCGRPQPRGPQPPRCLNRESPSCAGRTGAGDLLRQRVVDRPMTTAEVHLRTPACPIPVHRRAEGNGAPRMFSEVRLDPRGAGQQQWTVSRVLFRDARGHPFEDHSSRRAVAGALERSDPDARHRPALRRADDAGRATLRCVPI